MRYKNQIFVILVLFTLLLQSCDYEVTCCYVYDDVWRCESYRSGGIGGGKYIREWESAFREEAYEKSGDAPNALQSQKELFDLYKKFQDERKR